MNRFFPLVLSVLCVSTSNNVLAVPTIGIVGRGEDPCSFRTADVYSKMSFSYMVTPTNFTVEMKYDGAGWMGFGFPIQRIHSEDAFDGFPKTDLMDGTLSIIGEPETNVVSKFRLLDKTFGGVRFRGGAETLMDSDCFQETKPDGSIETVLRFTKALDQEGEPRITPRQVETFLWAFGYGNAFPGIHARRSVVQLDLTPCMAGAVEPNNPVTSQVENSVPKTPVEDVCMEYDGKRFRANNGKMKPCRFLKRLVERNKKAARANCRSEESTAAEICCDTCKPYLETSNN